MKLTMDKPLSSALPKSVVLNGANATGDKYGLRNTGFFGVPVKRQKYTLSFYARSDKPTSIHFVAGLYNKKGDQTFASGTQQVDVSSEWKQFTMSIDCSTHSNTSDNLFGLDVAEGSPDIQLNLISLFPPTWQGTVARQDLAQALADLKPVYFRLPGGNSLEGNSLAQRFVWNNTVGDLVNRPGRRGTWAGWDTDGYALGEAYKLFSQMGAKPILDVFAGYMLNAEAVEKDALQPYVDSVKDQIHYLTDTQGALASKRVADGQPEPWNLPWVEIGNEDYLSATGSRTYNDYRYDAFADAVKQAHSQVGIISSSAYYKPKSKIQAIDQHDYDIVSSLITRWSERDSWPRNGTQVAELEFSALNSGLCSGNTYTNPCRLQDPTLIAAVAEATFMMGFERNGDITFSAAYAPLLKNHAASQWSPDLITFDSLGTVVKSTSYHTQWAFGNNRIAHVHDVKSSTPAGPVYWSVGTTAEDANQYIVKLTNVADDEQKVVVQLDQGKQFALTKDAQLWQMTGNDKQAANTYDSPKTIVPSIRPLSQADIVDGALHLSLPPNTFAVACLSIAGA